MEDVTQQVHKREIRAAKEKLFYFHVLSPGLSELWDADSTQLVFHLIIIINGPGTILSSLNILTHLMAS